MFLSRLQWAGVVGWHILLPALHRGPGLACIPVIPMDAAWPYWVFRGKVRGDAGYH